jgi:uncharacterized SAM-binding protein YcdF (DUF218 family)
MKRGCVFHRISQVLAPGAAPTNLLIVATVLALPLAARPKASFFRGLALTAVALLVGLGILPAGDWLLRPLENRFPPYSENETTPSGLIVLGGFLSHEETLGGWHTEPNQSAGRLFAVASLARHYPNAIVLVSGGPIDPVTNTSEADAVAGYLEELAVPQRRILEERGSADTFENARFCAVLVHPRPGERWLLVTSAWHMPRAMGAFRAAGFDVVAAPADWRVGPSLWPQGWSASANLAKVDLATKEYIGLLAYRFAVRSAQLWPRPAGSKARS